MASGKGLVIAAPSSGSGKTLVTLGLLRALARRGVTVCSAKAGPDYIDPRFHEAASGRPCVNLDCWAMRGELVASLVHHCSADTDIMLVEGVMGLFDGAAGGGGSTADVAAMLALPVLFVVDAPRQGQSVAALVKGFADFRDDCRIAGVVFNRVASETHAALLSEAVVSLGIPVLGAVGENRDFIVPSRHLGLVQAGEHTELTTFLERAADLMEASLDLHGLMALAAKLGARNIETPALPPLGQRIATARDEAFEFMYPHLLDGWRKAGAEILPFSPLNDEAPDDRADTIFLPGGYPELHAGRLATNNTFLDGLRVAAQSNILVYGECGGFMVLGECLIDADGERHKMAGALPVTTRFARHSLKLGYRRLTQSNALPWPRRLRGHEFHYSTLERQGEADSLFEAEDSRGTRLGPMGLRRGNVMGSYAHVIDMEEAP